jgi:hypothetical protein
MDTQEVIAQRRFGRATTFRFTEDKLEFSFTDRSGQVSGSAFYEAIDTENYAKVNVNVSPRFIWLGFLVVFFVTLGLSHVDGLSQLYAALPIYLYFAFVVFVRSTKFTSVPFTILSVAGTGAANRIRIINDKDHDSIITRIKVGRVARLRKLCLPVNASNTTATEAKKYRWLVDNGIIDQTEYLHAIAQLEGATQMSPPNWKAHEPKPTIN